MRVLVFIAALLVFLGVGARYNKWSHPVLEWVMVNVNSTPAQADAHLIRFPNGDWFLIDAGNPDGHLLPALKKHHIHRLSGVLITHPHADHYSGLLELVNKGIELGPVHFNMPNKKLCDSEIPWGCKYDEVQNLKDELIAKGVSIVPTLPDEILFEANGARLHVLSVFDGSSPPVGPAGVNGMSPVVELVYGKVRTLFTGDLGPSTGNYLLKTGLDLRADAIKVPHHGASTTVTNEFMDRVGAKYAFVPAPETLWNSSRDKEMKEHLQARGTQVWVSGISGEVDFLTDGEVITVRSERKFWKWFS